MFYPNKDQIWLHYAHSPIEITTKKLRRFCIQSYLILLNLIIQYFVLQVTIDKKINPNIAIIKIWKTIIIITWIHITLSQKLSNIIKLIEF